MIELNITGVCRDCHYFDPRWIITDPYINGNGKFVDATRRVECRHEQVCYKLKEEKERGMK